MFWILCAIAFAAFAVSLTFPRLALPARAARADEGAV
jgi:hypothetical protein